MSDRHYRQDIHYCPRCGASFHRNHKETMTYACSGCNTWPMRHAVVEWSETIPDPDPLESLLVRAFDKETE